MYADSFNPFFQRKLADFDILGIISILKLLKCLDFFHVEANIHGTAANYNHKQHIWHSTFENCGKI